MYAIISLLNTLFGVSYGEINLLVKRGKYAKNRKRNSNQNGSKLTKQENGKIIKIGIFSLFIYFR
ncbi:hypothetical protein AB840_00680 [Megasphaera cerevisiae DSM 20462]|jgi:hypothetical protein|uniref:Uncharacterized protein n=1 Tax=Megasphaera cerevisiae DSM 20462 TaxID=1122219 RepID=A0A0J6X1A6_9FIRM|nr:hypothetical protein AB840_00680 [Megasphaera cerevisiae DSM 20462]